jgi:hypothetical protein
MPKTKRKIAGINQEQIKLHKAYKKDLRAICATFDELIELAAWGWVQIDSLSKDIKILSEEVKSDQLSRKVLASNLEHKNKLYALSRLGASNKNSQSVLKALSQKNVEISKKGAKARKETFNKKDGFAREQFLLNEGWKFKFSAREVARRMVEKFGSEKVGAKGTLERKISLWKKELKK